MFRVILKILDSFYFLKSEHLKLAFYAKKKNIDCAFIYTQTHSYTESVHADARKVHEDVCVSRQTLKMEIFKYCAGILSGNLRL